MIEHLGWPMLMRLDMILLRPVAFKGLGAKLMMGTEQVEASLWLNDLWPVHISCTGSV